MKRLSLLTLGAVLLGLAACSDSDNPDNPDNPDNNSQQSQPTTSAPTSQPQTQAGKPLSSAQQQALAEGKELPTQGTVLELMHAAGYTYMNVDIGSNELVWIAAATIRVKPQQKVKWTDAAVMHNFASKSLHRSFDKILFVSNAAVFE
jgi:hypothetical protein